MALLTDEIKNQISQALVNRGILTDEQLAAYETRARKEGRPFQELLEQDNIISKEKYVQLLAAAHKYDYIDLNTTRIDPETLNLLPLEIAENFLVVAFAQDTATGEVSIAMIDPENIQVIDTVTARLNTRPKVFMASEESIRSALGQYSLNIDDSTQRAVNTYATDNNNDSAENQAANIVDGSPISDTLNKILEFSVRSRASDVHIEPNENDIRVRCRIDGILKEVSVLPNSIKNALTSRVKILSKLKIDEHRIPQDGGFSAKFSGDDVDVRVSVSPIIWGEQIVLRLLDKSATNVDLSDLGFSPRALTAIKSGITKSSGMVILSGPTGSGKTTTLYALIKEIMNDTINIVTLEDPVEYKMPGVNQIQVDSAVGLTFSSGLRSILRQDPDVIMVGEIRDEETANLAVQAALTGHLVFSTLHTNSAAGILPRLIDMGVEPFLIASTVNTVVGQRLVRTNNENTEKYKSNAAETEMINAEVSEILQSKQSIYDRQPPYNANEYELYKGVPNDISPDGYKGRIGLYEVIDVDEDIQKMIMNNATSSQIQDLAIQKGMITMRQDGMLKALDGTTTLDEVNRVASNIA